MTELSYNTYHDFKVPKAEGCMIDILKGIGIFILLILFYFVVCWIFNSDGFAA